ENLGPGRVADRREGGDEPADGIITICERLAMDLPAVKFVGDTCLQRFHVAIGDAVDEEDQSAGQDGLGREWLESKYEKGYSAACVFAEATPAETPGEHALLKRRLGGIVEWEMPVDE